MTQIPGYYTRKEIAAILGISNERISKIAQRDKWTEYKIGRYTLYPIEDIQRTALKMDAQKAWAILGIPRHLWGAWWLADTDEIIDLICPTCGATAYQPAGDHKYSNQAACPACGWSIKYQRT
jgi:predicted RNA-binding Zn-ribbon protein involved in translation (DUF1610 family)